MIRGVITISGDVQEAGYRVGVRDTARKLGLVGFAENMPDGTVNVVCEGEKKKIETLIGSIKIKTETINVEKIDVVFEDAINEFKGKGFVVKVGDLGDELFQGFATSLKYFRVGWDKQDKMLEKQDKTLEKQDKTLEKQDKTLEKQDSMIDGQAAMHEDIKDLRDITRDSFTELKSTYGAFHKTMGSMQEELVSTRKELSKLVDYIGVLVKEHIQKSNE